MLDKNGCNVVKVGQFPNCVDTTDHTQSGLFWRYIMFGVLGPRCWTGSSMLDCHVLKGLGIYMIGILGGWY